MIKIHLIDIYIVKNFLMRFLQILGGFSLIIFFINLIDTFDKIKGSGVPFYAVITMAFLRVPEFINDIVPSLVLISSIITFFLLSSRSEITVIRIGGFFIWQILAPIIATAFLLGIFWITIFEPLSIAMNRQFSALEGKYVKHEMREVLESPNGIWLKQDNLEKAGEELVIKASKVYRKNLELDHVNIWFFDKDGEFYRRIDAEKALIEGKIWHLQKVIINDNTQINQHIASIAIPTDLEPDFVFNKVVNNFQNVKSFSIFSLPKLISDLKASGLQSRKFEVHLHSLITKPLLFVAMVLISCYFGLNHIRSHNSAILICCGIALGLVLYITSSVLNSFGASGIISVFASTWTITSICLAAGTLLIYRKEKL